MDAVIGFQAESPLPLLNLQLPYACWLSIPRLFPAWALKQVVSEFLTFVNALKVKSDATQVNLCRVFKLAKETAMSGNPPTHYQIMPMLDAAGLNDQLKNTLTKQDPILAMDLNVNENVKDPTGACNYKLTNVAWKRASKTGRKRGEDR